uniref:Glycerol-3-phosphate acyltransferase 3 n=1 Tax=Seriola lalandi dorsalis TaxID=1841481 RepID=A0A3B4WWE9_SERLL
MEDVWSVAVGVFQVWMFVVVFFIMLPAMFGLSLGVTGVYIQILVKILEVTETESFIELRQFPSVPVPLSRSLAGGEFSLSDAFYFYKKGLESIADDQVTQRFSSEELASWNLLTRTNQNFRYISLRLTVIWGVGVFVRYCVLFPLRITLAIIGLSWLVIGTTLVGFLPESSAKNWLSEVVHLTCYRICARGLSATVHYHNKENRPQKGGICVANHTTPIDVVILANDGCYAMVGQIHGGLMGVIQRSMVRSCPHVWFERSEMKDRHAVTSRLRAHVAAKTKLPILIFPEGQCPHVRMRRMRRMMMRMMVMMMMVMVMMMYDPRFGDAFWNSGKFNMVSYLLRMMTSWAIVVNVWYLPPMTIQVRLHLKDGGLKRGKVKDSFKEEQQKMYSKAGSPGSLRYSS